MALTSAWAVPPLVRTRINPNDWISWAAMTAAANSPRLPTARTASITSTGLGRSTHANTESPCSPSRSLNSAGLSLPFRSATTRRTSVGPLSSLASIRAISLHPTDASGRQYACQWTRSAIWSHQRLHPPRLHEGQRLHARRYGPTLDRDRADVARAQRLELPT